MLLTRQVAREISATGRSPWEPFRDLFRGASWVAGNLEGAVAAQGGDEEDARSAGPEGCVPPAHPAPCFAVPPSLVPLLADAGFSAFGLENNHAADLGQAGRTRTREALRSHGLLPLDLDGSPRFVRLGGTTVAVVAVSLVPGRDGKGEEIPSAAVRQKLRLARRLASFTVVFVHWGAELLDWPSASQRRAAAWFVRNGASVVAGHHPHVVQEPECVGGRPVFFSLGNHLFDQKYAATKEGLVADCRIEAGELACSGLDTRTPAGSSFPEPAGVRPLLPCRVRAAPPLELGGVALRPSASEGGLSVEAVRDGRVVWRTQPGPLLSLDAGPLEGPGAPELLLALERRPSPLDGEDGVRPYVYAVGPKGLAARWRGSGLAWPLLDATLVGEGRDRLCALHRADSFLVPDPAARGTRTAVYRWNGFGFSNADDPALLAECRAAWR